MTFSHADWHLASFGFNGYAEQLETFYADIGLPKNSGLGPGVMLRGVSYIDFLGNTVSHIGGHGLDILGNHVTVRHCTITDTGGSGVKLGFWSNADIIAKPSATRITSSYNEVSDCTIHDVARVYPNAVGIFTQVSDHGLYTHNTFSNMPYMGIMMGQNSLSYAEAPGTALAGNEISYNDFNHVQAILHDGAAIYCVGYLDNCLVHHNKVHDNPCADPNHVVGGAGWGIYLDQSTAGVTVRDNWVYRVNRGMHIFRNASIRGKFRHAMGAGHRHYARGRRLFSGVCGRSIPPGCRQRSGDGDRSVLPRLPAPRRSFDFPESPLCGRRE